MNIILKKSLLLFLFIHCKTVSILDLNENHRSKCDLEINVISNLCPDEQILLKTAEDKLPLDIDHTFFSSETLKRIQNSNGFPYAVASFTMGLLKKKDTRSYLKKVSSINIDSEKKNAANKLSNIQVLILPGVFYDRNSEIGGDGRQLRSLANSLGFKDGLIAIPPAGSIYENGKFICNWLDDSNQYKKILISISKGSADFKIALNYCGEKIFKSKKIVTWINLGGINKGTYLINNVDSNFFSKVYIKYLGFKYNFSYKSFLSLKAGVKNSILNQDILMPIDFRIINIIPAPIERYVTERAYENFLTLSELGPNDGLTLLGDSYDKGAINIPVWGIDHYFRINKEGWLFLQKILLNEARQCFPICK